MTTRASLFLLAMAGVAFLPAASRAHLGLDYPPSRYGSNVLEDGPCGVLGGARSDNVTMLEPGASVEIVWNEYINHPGHYRVAFDPDGDDDLASPACLSACDTRAPEIEQNAHGVMVLLDGIPDRSVTPTDNVYRVTVTLPDLECDTCTLQVIQVMYDKPPQTRPGNDIYFQCADLVLRRAGTPDAGPTRDAGSMDDGGTLERDGGPPPSVEGREPTGCGCSLVGSTRPFGLGSLLGSVFVLAIARTRSRGVLRRRLHDLHV